jgi:DNA polymerase/3'-5' exonuclease PolX
VSDNEVHYRLALADQVAAHVIEVLTPCCEKIMVAGSVRRRKETVHDVDIVLWPKVDYVAAGQTDLFGEVKTIARPVMLLNLLKDLDWYDAPLQEAWPRILKLKPVGAPVEVPVELYLTEPDGSNWGALLQMRTGDERFNIMLCQRAQRFGMKYRAGYGVFQGDKRMDDGTEDGIFRTLGLSGDISPERRWGDVRLFTWGAK